MRTRGFSMWSCDKALLKKLSKVLKYVENGDPIKDFLDDDEILEALILLNDVNHNFDIGQEG